VNPYSNENGLSDACNSRILGGKKLIMELENTKDLSASIISRIEAAVFTAKNSYDETLFLSLFCKGCSVIPNLVKRYIIKDKRKAISVKTNVI
jgi:hypothetical protein